MKKSVDVKKYTLIILIVVLLLFSLGILMNLMKKEKTRTIMIYMVGADLESRSGLASNDLKSIDYNSLDNKNINVVLIAGGSKRWDNSFIDKNETSIFELTENGFSKVKEQDVLNMGNQKVFSDYLNYVYDNYKTDEYELIFWNHGAAIYGSQLDELSKDVLSLNEMRDGFENSPFKRKKLETIIFRTCLNGTLEVSNILDKYSNYLVASEEITYGSKSSSVLDFINNIKPSDSGYDIGIKFIDSYRNNVEIIKEKYSKNSNIYSTYSIINLSKIKPLVASINDFVGDINIEKNYNNIARVRSNLYQYAYTQSNKSEYDMVDLYNLVDNLKEYNSSKANKVLNNIKRAVLYNWATNNNSRGISIYFPFNGNRNAKTKFLNIYKELNGLNSYYNFINDFYSIQTGSKSYSPFTGDIERVEKTKKSDFELELSDEELKTFAKSKYIIFKDNKDGYYQPIYIGGKASLNNNILGANINDRLLKVVDKKDKDNDGYILTLEETESSDEYIKYNTNVILQDFRNLDNFKMNNAQMNLIYNKKDKNIALNNLILLNNEEFKPDNESVDLKEYKTAAFGNFKYKILDDNGNFTLDWTSNGVYEGFEMDVKNIDFKLAKLDKNENYYCVFVMYDTKNDVHYSKLIKMN